MAAPQVTLVAGANVHKNAPMAIAPVLMTLTTFFMFVTTAFGANVFIRDQETGFGPLLYTTHIHRSDYVLGRTLGAFLVCALCLLSVPFGLILGSFMPWLDKETLGPFRLFDYLYPYLFLALPSVLFMVAIFSTAATLTRSMMGSYLTALALLVVYFTLSALSGKSDVFREIYAWLDPFGIGAIAKVTRYWTAEESNNLMPPLAGVILGNRLLVMGLAIGLIATNLGLLRFEATGQLPKLKRRFAKNENAPVGMRVSPSPISNRVTSRRPVSGLGANLAIFVCRTGFETAQVFTGPVYLVLMLMAMAMTALMTFETNQLYGTEVYPVTRVMISVVSSGFALFAMVVAIFYSGELVWRERGRRIHEILDATSMPNWAFLIPKALALLIVLASTLIFSVLADMVVQVFKGYTHFELGKYLLWYVLPNTLSFSLIGILALCVQSLSPNKFVGWALMVVYLGLQFIAGQLGWDHHLYMYASAPYLALSDMNGLGHAWIGWLAFKLYWASFAVILLTLAQLLWRRGVSSSLRFQLGALPNRLKGPGGAVMATASLVFVSLGCFLYYNTNILNIYRTQSQTEKNNLAFEKIFAAVAREPVPSVTAVRMRVDLYPHNLAFHVAGHFTMQNKTSVPIKEVYLDAPEALEFEALTLSGAHQAQAWKTFGVRKFVFDMAMKPGESRSLDFTASQVQRGFANSGLTTPVADNGTFLNNFEFAPRIGIGEPHPMQDKRLRRKYHLPPLKRMNDLEDPAADARNYIGADWTRSDITVSTVADQTPVAPGYLVSDVTQGGRRTARFVSDTPILNFFSVQSARYEQKHLKDKGIDLTVYYDQQHPYNVDGMLSAMATSLDTYQTSFSPYQFHQARIVEFPDYATFAQSFANTIPYSEGIGFIADVRNPDKIDYTTYVTAHELGHQWWAHQIVGADKQGAESLSETLAQYSALMVMEKMYGPDKIRRFLKFELDAYLMGRQTDTDEEMPLYKVQHEAYIYYNKGSLVMYLLKDQMGTDRVNAALRSLLGKFAFKGAPYPRSTDLINALRAQATPDQQALITDLFERITLVDLRAREARAVKRPDGKYDVSFIIEAHKFYAGGKGKESEAAFDQFVDLGLFTAKPGEGTFGASNVVHLEKRRIVSGVQRVSFITDKRPNFVGIDPYNKWIDRDSEDNVTEVSSQ